MTDHYSGSDAARGCGLLLIVGGIALLAICGAAAWALGQALS